jgi:flagellar hook-length control protein FliK
LPSTHFSGLSSISLSAILSQVFSSQHLFHFQNSPQNKISLASDVHICLARKTVPVNAPQLGTAVNNPAAAVGSSSLGDFLLANSTDFAGATDFKTIAAPFFAGATKPTSTGQVATPSFTASAKPSGAAVIRERETGKDNRPQSVESALPFLPFIPAHLLNIVPPQSQAGINLSSPSESPTHNDAQTSSTVATTSLPATASLQTELQPLAITQNFPLSQGSANVSQQPQDIKADETFGVREKLPQPLQGDAAAISQPQTPAIEEQISATANPNITQNDRTLQIPELSAKQPKPTSPITTDFAPGHGISTIDTPSAKTTVNHPAQKVATNPIHKELTQRNAGAPATNIAQTSTPSADVRPDPAIRPAQTIKPSASKQEHQSEAITPKQADSTVEVDPISQPPANIPQSVSETMKSIFAAAAVSINKPVVQTIVPKPEMSSTQDSPTPTIIALPKSGEPVASATSADLKNDKVTPPNVPTSSPAAIPTAKSGINKTRTEISKTKNLRTNAESTVDASSNTKEQHWHEVNPVSGPQTITNAGPNKTPDAATSVAHFAPHAKSTSAKSEPGISDSAPATQLPDADDTAPVAHTSINTAKLVQGLSQSELRVGFQTRDFGNIDIRTSVNRHEFSAQISVEHNDVARTLTTELPGLYARLNEQQVPVSSIHIQNQSLSTSSGLDQHSQQSSSHQQSGFVRSQLEPTLPAIQEVLNPTDRLDIRI